MTIALPPSAVVVFDLDDTLCSEREFLISGYRAVAQALAVDDLQALVDWMVARFDAGEEVLQAAIQRAGNSEVSLTSALTVYREHRPRITLRADAKRLLDRCAAAGSALALITDGRATTQRRKLDVLGLLGVLDPILISEELGVSKPDQTAFRRVMDAHPDRPCAYIADNPAKDFVAPNALGWLSICLRNSGQNIHPQNIDAAPPDARPRHVVDSLDDIVVDANGSQNRKPSS